MAETVTVLAGDVGGTKTLLLLARYDAATPERFEVIEEARFASDRYDGLAPMVDTFLAGQPRDTLHGACFGVAGPVAEEGPDQTAQLTNLPWRLDSRRLAQTLGLTRVRLINDFQAVGYGIEVLGIADQVPLQRAPARPNGPRMVLGAGTGLGVALLFHCNGRYEVHPTEGGHMDFAPVDELQTELLAFLLGQYRRVSYERVLSGAGLEAIYRFILYRSGGEAGNDRLLAADDPAAAISEAAFTTGDPRAEQALDLFVAVYGQCAGNLALSCLASGGVYIAGGIAPKILSHLERGRFIAGFNAKGRMEPLTRAMPINVVINPRVGLLGAAVAAARL